MKRFLSINLSILLLFPLLFNSVEPVSMKIDEEKTLNSMTLSEKIEQMLIIQIPTVYANGNEIDFTYVTSDVKEFLTKNKPGGLVLYKGNMPNVNQTKALTKDIQSCYNKIPCILCTDEEGGRRTNIPVDMNIPTARQLGDTGNPENAFKAAETIGLNMKDLGLNLDLAPVMDVNTNPKNTVIGNRSFSSDPRVVADFGVEFIKGLRKEGILSTAKHFPGHGDTLGDSTKGYVIVPHDLDRLNKVELYPFNAAIQENVDFVLVGHITVPALDATRVPASLSKPIVTGLLKEQMGFKGVVMTDSLIIAGITAYYNKYEAAKLAINSGNDVILRPDLTIIPGSDVSEYREYVDYLVNEVKIGNIKESRINEAVLKILQAKNKLLT